MSPGTLVLLPMAGFAAGLTNAIAGGGSLITFPALVATGLPTLDANVTNTVSVWPGYIGGTLGYRPELADQRRRSIVLGIVSLCGAAVGSVVLLVTDEKVFDVVVPFLVALSSLLLALQAKAAAYVRSRSAESAAGDGLGLGVKASVFGSAIYGAYFGGGLGVILLAVLGVFLHDTLQRLNGLKTLLSLVINSIALVVFALFGPVDWTSVALIAPAALAGGYAGAHIGRRIPANVLRAAIVTLGLVVAVWLYVK